MTKLMRIVFLGAAAVALWAAIALPQRETAEAPLVAFAASIAALVALALGRRVLQLEPKDIASLSMLAWTMLVCSGAFTALKTGDRLNFSVHEDGTVTIEAETVPLQGLRGALKSRRGHRSGAMAGALRMCGRTTSRQFRSRR